MKKLLICILLSAILFSCSPKLKLAGTTWTGTYTINNTSYPAQPYTFVFEKKGKLTTSGRGNDGKIYTSKGTWKLKGDTLRCAYTTTNFVNGPQVTQYAKFYVNDSLINGSWKDGTNGSNFTGTFPVMTKLIETNMK